jgi:glycosyltransferase involved in cell wall biosynthesis
MPPARGKRSAAGDAPASPLTGANPLGSSPEVDIEIVVPCYNEAARLRVADFVAFARDPETRARLLFVNDGSSDGTLEVLHKARRACPERIDVLSLPSNVGKAEAVRLGMRRACGEDAAAGTSGRSNQNQPPPSFVGFWDADLATPLDHVRLFRGVFSDRPETDMVFGARVGLLGRDIRRSKRRHYVGRVFATLASLALSMPVYDTQCGAKLFRVDGDLRAALSDPFDTRWVFDCELIGRYASLRRARDDAEDANGGASAARREKKPTRRTTTTESTKSAPVLRGVAKKPRRAGVAESIYEYPLHRWEDVAGSKVRPSDVVKMAWGLVRVRMKYFAREPWTPTRTPKSGARRAIGC